MCLSKKDVELRTSESLLYGSGNAKRTRHFIKSLSGHVLRERLSTTNPRPQLTPPKEAEMQ
eukprot:1956792-Amphidinium_carterae.1